MVVRNTSRPVPSARIGSTRCIGAIGAIAIFFIGVVYPGTLFTGDNGAFLCIPMKIGVEFEHCMFRAQAGAQIAHLQAMLHDLQRDMSGR